MSKIMWMIELGDIKCAIKACFDPEASMILTQIFMYVPGYGIW